MIANLLQKTNRREVSPAVLNDGNLVKRSPRLSLSLSGTGRPEKMFRVQTIRIYPNKAQAATLESWLRCARRVKRHYPKGVTMPIHAELFGCEAILLREIADQQMKRSDVAATYRLAMQSSESKSLDWSKVNKAIIERWSMAGLLWIKQQAWKGL